MSRQNLIGLLEDLRLITALPQGVERATRVRRLAEAAVLQELIVQDATVFQTLLDPASAT